MRIFPCHHSSFHTVDELLAVRTDLSTQREKEMQASWCGLHRGRSNMFPSSDLSGQTLAASPDKIECGIPRSSMNGVVCGVARRALLADASQLMPAI